MAATAWQVEGQYYENCNCDFVCPCVPGQMMLKPTKGSCTFAMGFQIERGRFGDVPLDGLGFVVVAVTPEEMAKGNWSVGRRRRRARERGAARCDHRDRERERGRTDGGGRRIGR